MKKKSKAHLATPIKTLRKSKKPSKVSIKSIIDPHNTSLIELENMVNSI